MPPDPPPSLTARSSRPLIYLCGMLFFLALILVGLSIFYVISGVVLAGAFFLLVAGLPRQPG